LEVRKGLSVKNYTETPTELKSYSPRFISLNSKDENSLFWHGFLSILPHQRAELTTMFCDRHINALMGPVLPWRNDPRS
jgi:hypothetical protein